MGWNGCRLVYLFAVAGVEGLSLQEGRGKSLTVSGSLSSDLLIMHGWEVWLRLSWEGWALVPPASFTSLTSPAWPLFIYLWMGWKRVLFSQSRAKHLQQTTLFPFARCVFHLVSLFSM